VVPGTHFPRGDVSRGMPFPLVLSMGAKKTQILFVFKKRS
jgi:hypothetical protein